MENICSLLKATLFHSLCMYGRHMLKNYSTLRYIICYITLAFFITWPIRLNHVRACMWKPPLLLPQQWASSNVLVSGACVCMSYSHMHVRTYTIELVCSTSSLALYHRDALTINNLIKANFTRVCRTYSYIQRIYVNLCIRRLHIRSHTYKCSLIYIS